MHHLRYHGRLAQVESVFGDTTFGQVAERVARFFGTPIYLVTQTILVFEWICINVFLLSRPFDPYPFILLNLAFSTQAAYAAPLILLAQTRQAERDKERTDADARHREELAQVTIALLRTNTTLTEEVALLSRQLAVLTQEIHHHITAA